MDDAQASAGARLFPGTYAISIKQDGGSPSSQKVVQGVIHLACYARHWSGSGVYGWIYLDFTKLAAPLDPPDLSPAPDSDDPDAPGVRVSKDGHETVLFIGSAANIKPRPFVDALTGRVGMAKRKDGGGIALTVEEAEADRFRGTWNNAGIYAAGWGSFSARLVADVPGAR